MATMLALLFADHSLLAPNLTAAADDLGMDATARDVRLGGWISFLVTASAALAALVVGPWVDRRSRVRLWVASVGVAEVSCLAVFWVETWEQLAILRVVTGLGLGAAVPVAISLAADLVPRARRSLAIGVLWTALGLGMVMGILVAGQLGPIHGWRLPFAAVALPNLLLALIFSAAVREPSRAGAVVSMTPPDRPLRTVLARPIHRWLYAAEVFEILPFAVLSTFFPDYLAQDRGFTVQQASWTVAAFGVAAVFGKLGAGWLGDRWVVRGVWMLPIVAGSALIIAWPLAVAMLFVVGPVLGGGLFPALALAAAAGATAPIPKPLNSLLLVEINPATMRGAALAGHRAAAHVGQALGPLVAAGLIVVWGRQAALGTTFTGWFVAGLLLLGIGLARRRVEHRAT